MKTKKISSCVLQSFIPIEEIFQINSKLTNNKTLVFIFNKN